MPTIWGPDLKPRSCDIKWKGRHNQYHRSCIYLYGVIQYHKWCDIGRWWVEALFEFLIHNVPKPSQNRFRPDCGILWYVYHFLWEPRTWWTMITWLNRLTISQFEVDIFTISFRYQIFQSGDSICRVPLLTITQLQIEIVQKAGTSRTCEINKGVPVMRWNETRRMGVVSLSVKKRKHQTNHTSKLSRHRSLRHLVIGMIQSLGKSSQAYAPMLPSSRTIGQP